MMAMLDGSWGQNEIAGAAALIYYPGGIIKETITSRFQAHDPFMVEAEAMKMALKKMLTWGASRLIDECAQLLQVDGVEVQYSRRGAVHGAHYIANAARRNGRFTGSICQKIQNAPSCFIWNLRFLGNCRLIVSDMVEHQQRMESFAFG